MEAAEFYNNRYYSGYMEEWPRTKKERVLDLIKGLNLPNKGTALDFGCGNGEFTGVLKKALPGWNIYGADISSVAIKNARVRHPDCSFFIIPEYSIAIRFDFLFTHHVLEHATDIQKIWAEMSGYAKKNSSMLHILPCGNSGSFEYRLCTLKKNGIERDAEDRFYFEEEGHLRRLTTQRMNELALGYNFSLVSHYYSNQMFGALDWITLESPKFILQMTGIKKAKDVVSMIKLTFLRIFLLFIKLIRFPANTIDHKKSKTKPCKYYLLLPMLLILYPFSKLINIYIKKNSDLEWKNKKNIINGSEMYLFYSRN